MFAPVCSCAAGFVCALPSRFHFQIRSLSWTMTETKSGGRRLKWGSICGTFSFPQKCGRKVAPSLWGRSIVSESAAMFSGWSGTEKKDRKVLQSLCGSNRNMWRILSTAVTQPCVFGQHWVSSVLLRKLCRLTQHCHLLLTCRHADARVCTRFKYCKQSKSVTDFYCYKPKEKYSSSLSLHLIKDRSSAVVHLSPLILQFPLIF